MGWGGWMMGRGGWVDDGEGWCGVGEGVGWYIGVWKKFTDQHKEGWMCVASST